MATIKPTILGHGEGHDFGPPMMIVAANAAKHVTTAHHIPGPLMIWPSVAEELPGTKTFYVRDGLFKGWTSSCLRM